MALTSPGAFCGVTSPSLTVTRPGSLEFSWAKGVRRRVPGHVVIFITGFFFSGFLFPTRFNCYEQDVVFLSNLLALINLLVHLLCTCPLRLLVAQRLLKKSCIFLVRGGRSYLVPEAFGEVFLHPRNWDPVVGSLRP